MSDPAAATRCLVVSPRFPEHPDDWRARFVAGHTAALALAFGAENVRLVAPRGAAVPSKMVHLPFAVSPRIMAPHGAPERLAQAPFSAGFAALGTTANLLRAVRAARRRRAPNPGTEVCVAHWLVPGALAALTHGGAAVLVAHGGDVSVLEALPGARALLRRVEDRSRFVAVSAPLALRIEALLGRPPRHPIAVLPMGVDAPAPDPHFAAAVRARAAGRPVVATVGRLVPIKGLDVLLAALASDPLLRGALWVAAGSGAWGAELKRQAEAAGVRTWFPGDLGPGARDALLAEAQVFVQPSRTLAHRTEGTPVALLEALASGAPCVVTATGGMPAVLAGLEGVCPAPVPPDDPVALAQALRAVCLASAETHAAQRQACVRAGARYTWAHLGPLHAAVVAEAAGHGGPSG